MLKSIFIMTICLLPALATAQTSAPTTTTAPARRAVIIPKGFNKIVVAGHTLLVEPTDEAWARQAMTALTPTTLPTTMPATLLSAIEVNRAKLIDRITTDLALSDRAMSEKLFDEKLVPALKKLQEIHPPLFFLITTEVRLKELLKGGWSDPRFTYNRITDKVQVGMAQLSGNAEADDVLVPVLYIPGDSTETKSKQLAATVHDAEGSLAELVAIQGMNGAQLAFVSFIIDQVFTPLKLKRDQEWLGIGLSGLLSCRYSAVLTGVSEQQLFRSLSADDPRNPLRAATIDLIHPPDLTSMRPQAITAYAYAYRTKSTRAMLNWLNRAGDGAVAKLLTELRKSMPADGDGLVKQIQQTSGVDLTSDVAADK